MDLKQGISCHLGIWFNGIELDDVESVEFLFCDASDKQIKYVHWVAGKDSSAAFREKDDIWVGLTMADTMRFTDQTVILDTRVHMKGTTDMPLTYRKELMVEPTSFRGVPNGYRG